VMNDQANGVDESLIWEQLAALGWLIVSVDEDQGGLGEGLPGMCVVVREMARRVASAPIIPALLVIDALAVNTNAAQAGMLEALMAGDLASCSLAESHVKRDGNLLSGTLTAVPSADNASQFLVWDSQLSCLVIVPADAANISLTYRKTWDATRRFYDVSFDGVVISKEWILSENKVDIIMLLAKRDFLIAADCLGAAEGILMMTLGHLLVREQFARPLAMFQALKHRCANIKADLVAAESILMDKLTNATDLVTAGAAVKQFNSDVFNWAAEDALQLHGGVGMASEHDCHLFLKRAMLNKQLGHTDKQTTQMLVKSWV